MSLLCDTIPRTDSFAAPGETFLIVAPSTTLRKHLTDSYWCEAMEQVCDGKLEGVAVRYTGEQLVMLQFRPDTLSPAGYRYPLFMSIPIDLMVPVRARMITMPSTELHGSFGTATSSSAHSLRSGHEGKPHHTEKPLPKLCVVCGVYNVPGMLLRRNGWKCKDCKGTKSLPKLRAEASKLQAALGNK